jgi:hypothetical protein
LRASNDWGRHQWRDANSQFGPSREACYHFRRMKDLPIFAGVTPAELELITSAAQSKYFSDGEIISKDGSPIREVAMLLTGSVEIKKISFRNEITLDTIAPGAFVGPIRSGFINRGTAQAVGASTALVWDTVELEKLAVSIPRFRRNILAALELRCRALEQGFRELRDRQFLGIKRWRIKRWIGSLIAVVIGLACYAGALLVGVLTAKTYSIHLYRAEWLLAAFASFMASILLNRPSSDREILEDKVERYKILVDLVTGYALSRDSSSDEPDAPVRAPLRPKPNLRSGAIALPEPEPEESSNASVRSILI